MRTVELSDEVFARAEREASERGVPVSELVNQVVDSSLPQKQNSVGHRVKFPLIHSGGPAVLRITKEMLDDMELEDDFKNVGHFR